MFALQASIYLTDILIAAFALEIAPDLPSVRQW